MKRFMILAGVLLALGLVGLVAFWFGTPRLQNFSPQDGSLDVSTSAALRLTFSRSMRPDSVLEHLKFEPSVPGSFNWQGRTLVFTPDQRWPAGEVINVNLSKGAQAGGWLPLPTLQTGNWAFTVRQPSLLYLYPSNGAANLYLYDPRTEQSSALTNLLGGILEFTALEDGSAVYYSVENGQGGSDIYRLALGKDLTNLRASLVLGCQRARCRAPHAAPKEDFLAYERIEPSGSSQPNYPRVYLVQLKTEQDEAGELTITTNGDPVLAIDNLHQTIQPDWSLDGVLSFYDTNQQSFIILDPYTREITALQNQTGEPGSWQPGSQFYVASEIYFNTAGNPDTVPDLQAVASSHLLRYDISDGSFEDLTNTEGLEDTSPAISPDGNWIAFARKFLDISRWTPGRQLWLMKSDISEAHQLTNEPDYNTYNISWEPDGNRLAYVRFNQTAPTDLPAIWVYDLVKNYEAEWVPGGYSPQWIP